MDSAREPLPAFVDPSLVEVPFEVAVLGTPRVSSTDASRAFDDNDVMDALLDHRGDDDTPAGSSTAQRKREARAAARLATKQATEAARLAAAQAKAAAKQAKLHAKAEAKLARRGGDDVVADIASDATVEPEREPAPGTESESEPEPVVARRDDDHPLKKPGLSFDELIGGSAT